MSNNSSAMHIKYLVFSALFAALTAVFTAFVHIPMPGLGGYIHLGDTLIYLAAAMLPLPYALASAALGGFFADLLAGAAIWAPASLIIKALLVIAFTRKKDKIICTRNTIACGIGVVITIVGYYFAEVILLTISGDYENASMAFSGALVSSPWNLLQAVASAVAFFLIGFPLDKSGIRNKLI